jgi:hypothetical protein
MFKPDRLAERAGAILFEKIDQRLESLLAEHGVSDPGELSPTEMNEVFQRAIVEAAGCFPTANLAQLTHGFRSFVHPAFMPAWDRVKSATAVGRDPFAFSSGVDAAVLLAGFGLAVAPFDFQHGIHEKPTNDIDIVLAKFSSRPEALVGYDICGAPFYVLLTDCVRTLVKLLGTHPNLFDVRRLFERNGGSLPANPRNAFVPGMVIFAREPSDMISTILVHDRKPDVGSLMLHAGWRVKDQAYGAPYDGYLPVPVALLRAVAYEPAVASAICRRVTPPPRPH